MKRLTEQLVYSGLIHLHVLREEDRYDGSISGWKTGRTVLAQGGGRSVRTVRLFSSPVTRASRTVLSQGGWQVGRFFHRGGVQVGRF